jgi:hypothetical protein
MNKDGPVIIIYGDANSQKLLFEVFVKLEYSNEIVFFFDIDKALDYLEKGKKVPFLIFLEISLLLADKILFKMKQQKNAALQTVPYLFFSQSYDHQVVTHANKANNQGYFIMQDLDDTVELVTVIIEYWKRNISPTYY